MDELKFNNEHCAQVHRQEQFTASVKFTIMITSVVAYHRYAINCASEDLDSGQWHSSQTYVGVLVLGDLFSRAFQFAIRFVMRIDSFCKKIGLSIH